MKRKANNTAWLGQIGLNLLLLVGCLRMCGAEVDLSKLPPPATNKIDFAHDVRPILEESCLRCHGPEKPKSGFRLDNRAAALKGGDNGVDIQPGNSAKSPLIHNVAYLVEDLEMPPVGKGKQLTPVQVSILRAWIDQGAVWGATTNASLDFAFSPSFGDTAVSGNKQKFRELNWQPGGVDDRVDQFRVFKQFDPDTKLLVDGHLMADDYEVNLALDRAGLGFIHSGWQQYRKYYDDFGGYDPNLHPSSPSLGQDLYLDIGKAWMDFGVAVPDWPQLVVGYEYDYKHGNEATTEWNYMGPNSNAARNLGPASENLNEIVHVIKVDLDYDIKGVTLADRFRGEFYHLSTGNTNASYVPEAESEHTVTSYFQGANTFTLERKMTAWLFLSGGYLYSKLNSDSTVQLQLDTPAQLQSADLPRIALRRESNVGNVNALVGPVAGFTLSTGALVDFTGESSFGSGLYERETITPFSIFQEPIIVDSDYDDASVQETASLRFSKIPFTSLFAEGKLEQETIGQSDQFQASPMDPLTGAAFLQHTDFSSRSDDWRAGFDTSPSRFISVSAHYRHNENVSAYDSGLFIQPPGNTTAYPTFIESRDIITDEVEARVVLHPSSIFKTTLSYQYHTTDYDVGTRPFALNGSIYSLGGALQAAAERAGTYSISATWIPKARLYFTAAFSYQNSDLTTWADPYPSVVPYHGNIYTLLANGTYVLSQTMDLSAGYFFSDANYGDSNYAQGLPLGIEYQRHSAQVGISKKLGKNASARLQYRFDYYNEPTSGGANNFTAHSIYGTLAFSFP